MYKVYGNSVQNGVPSPEEPKEIINEIIVKTKDGKEVRMKIGLDKLPLKQGDYIFKKNGKWYLHKNKR